MTQIEQQNLINDYVNFKSHSFLKKKYKICYNTLKQICIEHKVWDKNRHEKAVKLLGEQRRYVQKNPFLDLNNKNVQYWLGILATDGAISSAKNTVQLSLKDLSLIKKYKRFLNSKVRISSHFDKRFKTNPVIYRISFNNKEIKDYLINLGIVSRKSLILKLNLNFTWDLLRGIIDGDGYIGCNRIDIATASFEFKDQIVDFLIKEGFTPKVYNRKNYYTDKKDLYTIRIARKQEVKDMLYKIYNDADTFLERKYHKARLMGNH